MLGTDKRKTFSKPTEKNPKALKRINHMIL